MGWGDYFFVLLFTFELVSSAAASVVSVGAHGTNRHVLGEVLKVNGLEHSLGVGINFNVGGKALHDRDLKGE